MKKSSSFALVLLWDGAECLISYDRLDAIFLWKEGLSWGDFFSFWREEKQKPLLTFDWVLGIG